MLPSLLEETAPTLGTGGVLDDTKLRVSLAVEVFPGQRLLVLLTIPALQLKIWLYPSIWIACLTCGFTTEQALE